MTDSNDVAKTLLEQSEKGKLKPLTKQQLRYVLGWLTPEQRRKKDGWEEE